MIRLGLFFSAVFGGLSYLVTTSDLSSFSKFALNFVFIVCSGSLWIAVLISCVAAGMLERVGEVVGEGVRGSAAGVKEYAKKEREKARKAQLNRSKVQIARPEEVDEEFDEQLRKEGSLHGPSVSSIFKNL